MKKFIISITILILAQYMIAKDYPIIIPEPVEYASVNDVFKFDKQLKIAYDESYKSEAHFLQKELFKRKNLLSILESDKKAADIILIKSDTKFDANGSYSLNMDKNQVTVKAQNGDGIFNGIVSLIQLLTNSDTQEVKCWNIEDSPAYDWRGFMLDESRHFYGKEKVKQLLDYMAFYKLNKFHWHLTDEPGWRIEIKNYPLLAYTGGVGNYTDHNATPTYYTQEEINEIVLYASERKIMVIPEIDMPGHARAANRAYPEFSGGGSERYPEFTFDPGKEETYQYLTNILKEINVLFPSNMIHLGGDEVHFGNEAWNHNEGVKSLMKREGLTKLEQVEKYFMSRMADSVFLLNNKVLAWDEMAEISLPTDKTIIFWWRHDQKDQLQKALDKEYPVVLCPRIPLYFDFVQDESHKVGRRWAGEYSDLEKVYKFNTEKLIQPKYSSQVLGIQANLWTEEIASEQRLDFMTYPRISALSEAAWGQNNDYQSYLERLKSHLKLYNSDKIYHFNPFDTDGSFEPNL